VPFANAREIKKGTVEAIKKQLGLSQEAACGITPFTWNRLKKVVS
jgi:hypothetical protein